MRLRSKYTLKYRAAARPHITKIIIYIKKLFYSFQKIELKEKYYLYIKKEKKE